MASLYRESRLVFQHENAPVPDNTPVPNTEKIGKLTVEKISSGEDVSRAEAAARSLGQKEINANIDWVDRMTLTPFQLRQKQDELVDAQLLVASNASTPPDVFLRLAGGEDPRVREMIALNPKAPPDTLVRLSEDKTYQNINVRVIVAGHINAKPELLELLSIDESEGVRNSVANNENTPPDALARLADKDQPLTIRLSVSRNPNTPPDIVARLRKELQEKN